jgi:heme oxygenase
MKHGASLGSQAAHHACANTTCVNPDHLQPVTHRENIAEMMARKAYVARIRELEAALTEIQPSHPLLSVIAVA